MTEGAVAQNTQGQVKLSLMSPGIHVLPHCGPTNVRVRMHLGLCVPSGVDLQFIVGGENVSWTEGKVTVFDDSFEHEIVFPDANASSASTEDPPEEDREQPPPTAMALIDTGRLVLLFDTWHPSLTPAEIAAVRAITQSESKLPRRSLLILQCALWHLLGATGQDSRACCCKQPRI